MTMIAVSSLKTSSGANASPTAPTNAATQPLPPALALGLSPRDMQRVNAARPSCRTLQPGESLYFQGDECRNIYLLLDGWAFRHQGLEDGRRQILDFALPGGAFGLTGTGVMTHSLEALTPCTFSAFGRDSLCELLQQVPVLALRFVELLADAQTRAFEHLTNVGRRSARERVANLLMELIMRSHHGVPGGERARMVLPLMQPHIADALGLASETVCRALSAMRKDGIVVLRAQKLEVLDIEQLASEAGMELDQAMPSRRVFPAWGVRTPAMRSGARMPEALVA
jgi:CRP/FNR family transcriptional regulator, anaerobic regulatory protein